MGVCFLGGVVTLGDGMFLAASSIDVVEGAGAAGTTLGASFFVVLTGEEDSFLRTVVVAAALTLRGLLNVVDANMLGTPDAVVVFGGFHTLLLEPLLVKSSVDMFKGRGR